MRTAGRRWALLGLVLGSLTAAFPAAATGQKGPQPRALQLPGQVEAAEQAQLYSRIVGFVQKADVDIGDRVKKGQVLAELAVPELEAELRQKEALVARAAAEAQHAQQVLREATATLAATTADVQQAEAAVRQAQAKLEAARAAHDRARKLAEEKVIDTSALDEKAQQFAVAKAALEEAEAKAQSARATREALVASKGSAEEGIKVAVAQKEAAAAEVQRAAAMLRYARITAPFDGVVTRRDVAAGALVGPPGSRGQPLFTVARVDTVRVIVAVPEEKIGRVRVGAEAVFARGHTGAEKFKGKVARTGGALDPHGRTLRVEIDLPNGDGKLIPGMTGTVSITLAED
jgi:multidrug efflux pump subunit AcrA (membrane-fusion protein)